MNKKMNFSKNIPDIPKQDSNAFSFNFESFFKDILTEECESNETQPSMENKMMQEDSRRYGSCVNDGNDNEKNAYDEDIPLYMMLNNIDLNKENKNGNDVNMPFEKDFQQHQSYLKNFKPNAIFKYLLGGKLIHFLKNVNGSKLLQQALKTTDLVILLEIFDEITPHISELMTNPYGNYFVQQYYLQLPLQFRIKFLEKFLPSILEVSSNSIGNYSVQFIVDCITSQEEMEILIYPFTNRNILYSFIWDPNSIHVIEKLIMKVPERFIPFIYEFVLINFVNLASNKSTLNLVKKIIVRCQSILVKVKIVSIICSHFKFLIFNSIANNSIQCVLEVRY